MSKSQVHSEFYTERFINTEILRLLILEFGAVGAAFSLWGGVDNIMYTSGLAFIHQVHNLNIIYM